MPATTRVVGGNRQHFGGAPRLPIQSPRIVRPLLNAVQMPSPGIRTFAYCTIAYLCTATATPLQSHLVRMPNGELVRFAQQPQTLAITPAVGAQPRRQFFARDPRTGALRPLSMAELSGKFRFNGYSGMAGIR